MIDFSRISRHRLRTDPFRWAFIDEIFSPADAAALADTFPRDHFKRHSYYGGDKDSEYEARALVGMGQHLLSSVESLSSQWRALGNDLISTDYRAAISSLTGIDLSSAPLEVNVFHYPPGGLLRPMQICGQNRYAHPLFQPVVA
jgi:hypothetical protein